MTDGAPDGAELAERRKRRLWLLGASFVMVAVLVAIAIAVGGDDDEAGTTTGKPEGTAEALELYDGIPQRGIELGNPQARFTMTEFADLQCPFCGQYGRDVLPEIVRRYVRPGKLKLVFRNLAFIGEDSEEAARFAAAAGLQNTLYQFVDLLYRNQGAEETGWVDDEYLRRIGTAVGLNVDRAFEQRDDPAVRAQLEQARAEAEKAGIDSTPGFLIAEAGRPPERLEVEALAVPSFTEVLDRVIEGG